MTDQSMGLAFGLSALFVKFAIALAVTGDLTRAFDQVAPSRNDEQSDPAEMDNLLWD